MYERFTDRARKVMQLANQEAQRFNHEYLGDGHILLGLIKEGFSALGEWSLPLSTANHLLVNLSVNLQTVYRDVEKLVQSGPDMVTMGKLPQTPRAKKVIEYSMKEARNLNHNYVGTEHILLGLLREQEGVAAQVLMNLGLKLEEVREEVLNLLGWESKCDPPAAEDAEAMTFGDWWDKDEDSFRQALRHLMREPFEAGVKSQRGEIERLRKENRGLKDLVIDDWPIEGVAVICLPGRHGGYERGSQRFAGDDTWWWFPTREAAEAALVLAAEESQAVTAKEAERKGEKWERGVLKV